MKKNQKYNKSDMFQVIEAWKQSSQTQGNFCKEHKYSISTFQYWLKKYREDHPKSQLKLKKSPIVSTSSQRFLPLEVSGVDYLSGCKTDVFDIHYPNGVRLSCSADIKAEVLRTLINL